MPIPDNSTHTHASLAGFLLVDKPLRMSSMQAVAKVRRLAGGIKTGHAGTLDPLAMGLLVVAVGTATRSLKHLTGLDKRYHTVVDLSAFTATDDAEGELDLVPIAQRPSTQEVEQALARFVGEITQVPPAFSAIKVGGKRAYKLARKGATPEMPPRKVTLHAASLLGYHWPHAEIELHTSSGFYVRSLARDLGKSLGTGGFCASIRRRAVGPFQVEHAIRLDVPPSCIEPSMLMPISDVLGKLKSRSESRSRSPAQVDDGRGT